jgi:hypothetical protein
MMCPDPETLSRWRDGELDAREAPAVGVHVDACPSCRRRVETWARVREMIWSAPGPGPDCLGPEDMALALEGKLSSEHLESCAWCSTELASLRPARRRATGLFRRPASSSPRIGWGVAAAAALFSAGLLAAALLTRSSAPAGDVVRSGAPEPPPVRVPERAPVPPPPAPAPPAPAPAEKPAASPAEARPEPARAGAPPASAPAPAAKPAPPPAEPVTEPEKPGVPPTPAPPRTTVAEAIAPRKGAALAVRSGGLATATGVKLAGAVRVEEGATLRAEGRTTLEFAKARVTLDASSKFSVSGDALALLEGELAAEAFAGSKFSLDLGILRVVPQTAHGRVLLSARPDRVVVDEGFARWGEIVLHEGVEHHLRKDKLEPSKGRSLRPPPRPRETVTWKLDLKAVAASRRGLTGRVDVLPEGRVLACEPMEDRTLWDATLGYYDPEGVGLFTVKANTALRFRYFLAKPAPMELVAWNMTKDENFNLPIEAAAGQWTTVTVFWRDVPANPGGKKVVCEVGDKFRGVGFFVGKPGTSPSLTLDRLEILEIER